MGYYSYFLSKNTISIYWPIKVLRILLESLSSFLFLPIFYLFVSTFKCVDPDDIVRINGHTPINNATNSTETNEPTLRHLAKVNCIAPTIECLKGAHIIHTCFGIIFAILHFFIAFIFKTTFFETKISSTNPHSKLTSSNDQFLLFTKAFLAIIFSLFAKKKNSWILICFLICFSFALLYYQVENHPHNNHTIYLIYYLCFSIFVWANITLLLGQIFENSSYNGCLPLFFLGIPIIFLIVLTTHKENMYLIQEDISRINRPMLALKKIQSLLDLLNQKEISRKASVLLKGYVYQYETTFPFQTCHLKKFIESINKKEEVTVFFLQHIEFLYNCSLSKFPNKVILRISYSLFLLEYLNKKQQAAQEIANCEMYATSIEEKFVIYRTKKLIEEQTLELNSNTSEFNSFQEGKTQLENNVDIVASLSYKKYLLSFKNLINRASLLYIDFWSLLLNPNEDSKHLTKLNDFGTKINKTVGELKQLFEKIQKIKHNDKETIYYYSDFLNDILNDKEQASKLKLLIEAEDSKPIYDENNYYNLDIIALSSSDEYQYIVISGKPETFGIITNISLGVCLIFGYSRNELIGKAYDIFIPEIFQKMHREILYNQVNDYKKEQINFNTHTNSNNKTTTFKTVKSFGRNKARYLVPLILKVALIHTESNGISFVAKIYRDITITNSVPLPNQNKEPNQTAFILTNNYLIIQNFTANSISLLGLNSNFLNNTVEISSFIKQFHEEILKYMIDSETNLSPKQKMQIKRQIIASKFKSPVLISWKNPELNQRFQGTKYSETPKNSENLIKDSQTKGFATNTTDDIVGIENFSGHPYSFFCLTINEAMIGGKQEGYIFKFDPVNNNCEMTKYSFKNASTGSLYNINLNNRKSQKHIGKVCQVNPPSLTSLSHNFMLTNQGKRPSGSNQNLMQTPKHLNNSDFQIDDLKSFIPQSDIKFQFDPNKISFLLNPNNPDELREDIKKKAFEKIKENIPSSNNDSDDEEEESEEGGTSSDEFDNNTSGVSSSQSSITKDIKPNLNTDLKIKSGLSVNRNKSGTVNNEDNQYYKICFDKIKFSIYDYSKKMIVEQPFYEKISQVESKKNEDSKKKSSQNTDSQGKAEDTGDQGSSSGKKGNYQYFSGKGDKNDPNGNTKLVDKKAILIKQIEYSLLKQEAQPAVTRFKWFDFIIFIILLGGAVGFIYFFYYAKRLIAENFVLIKYSNNLIVLSLYSLANVRELTLLAHDNYDVFLDNRENDRNYILNETKNLYIEMHTQISYIVTTFLPLTPEHYNSLFSNLLNIAVIRDDLNINYYKMPLSGGFIEVNTAIFHIANDIENFEYYPWQIYIFFYQENLNNEIYFGLEEQSEIFVQELKININKIRNIIIYCIVGLLLVLCLCFFMMSYSYNQVAILKESYLEVFFEIGTNVIKGSLEKCEKFTKKIQSETFSEFLSNFSDDMSYTENENSLFVGGNQGNPYTNENNNQNNGQNSHHRRKGKNEASETLIIKIYFFIFLALVFGINLLFFLLYITKIMNLNDFVVLYRNQNNIMLQQIKFYNYLRDFIFDKNIKINGTKISEFFEKFSSSYYSNLYQQEQSLSNYLNKVSSDFANIYFSVYHNDLCKILSINMTTCQSDMYNSTEMGFSVLLSNLIEEIRSIKTDKAILDLYNEKLATKFIYNYTEYGTKKYQEYIDSLTDRELYDKYAPFQLYTKKGHRNLKKSYYNLLKPARDFVYSEMTKTLENYIKYNSNLFIYLWYGYAALIVICYISIWKSFEYSLTDVIFKTKNMLSIIPKEVLANVSNIQRLLGINQTIKKNIDKAFKKK